MPIPVETAAGSRDQRQDVFGSGSPRASGTVRWTGEVAAEKMERMGHSSQRAAMIYLHVSKGRSRHLADKLSAQLRAARATDDGSTEEQR
jgi:hypothetical protein